MFTIDTEECDGYSNFTENKMKAKKKPKKKLTRSNIDSYSAHRYDMLNLGWWDFSVLGDF